MLRQTRATSLAGTTPGDASRAANAAQRDAEDWRAILREFIDNQTPSDYSWAVPNRRFIGQGLYLPGVVKENIGWLAIAVDTSGSIDQPVLNCFATEITAIMHEARPEAVDVLYCDTEIKHTEVFTPDDPEVKLDDKGGGGTHFQPVFDHLNAMDEKPMACLYFTDLENYDKVTEPTDYPVLWITGVHVTKAAPFGRTIRCDIEF